MRTYRAARRGCVVLMQQVCHISYSVNLAYRVVVPRVAVAGIPADYANSIIDNTLSLLATLMTTKDLLEVWK